MKKIIITFAVITMGLSAQAFDWAGLGYQPYQQGNTQQPSTFSVVQPVNPSYNNMFYQDPNQVQCQVPYVNPYRTPYYGAVNPYRTINPLAQSPLVQSQLLQSPYNTNVPNVPSQIVRNIGQSVLYSMMRGY